MRIDELTSYNYIKAIEETAKIVRLTLGISLDPTKDWDKLESLALKLNAQFEENGSLK